MTIAQSKRDQMMSMKDVNTKNNDPLVILGQGSYVRHWPCGPEVEDERENTPDDRVVVYLFIIPVIMFMIGLLIPSFYYFLMSIPY